MVFSLALHSLRSRPAAEDVTQDVFVELYRSLSRIRSAVHAGSWLRRVACHRCIDELRRRVVVSSLPAGRYPIAVNSISRRRQRQSA
jgi:DNA-directed RNA polymerase specialized sigma24 family protein